MNQNQNQQKIKNPETQVPKTPQMNERDFINDLLTTEKYMTTSYSMALHEASHQGLYQDMMQIFSETQNCQRDLYNQSRIVAMSFCEPRSWHETLSS